LSYLFGYYSVLVLNLRRRLGLSMTLSCLPGYYSVLTINHQHQHFFLTCHQVIDQLQLSPIGHDYSAAGILRVPFAPRCNGISSFRAFVPLEQIPWTPNNDSKVCRAICLWCILAESALDEVN